MAEQLVYTANIEVSEATMTSCWDEGRTSFTTSDQFPLGKEIGIIGQYVRLYHGNVQATGRLMAFRSLWYLELARNAHEGEFHDYSRLGIILERTPVVKISVSPEIVRSYNRQLSQTGLPFGLNREVKKGTCVNLKNGNRSETGQLIKAGTDTWRIEFD